jgi:putative tricarboxylic transport membrane protein
MRCVRGLPKYWMTLLCPLYIGCRLGITPGDMIAASFMGYNLGQRFSKDPESFEKGRIEGVFVLETAAHASGTSTLFPVLALGIPGSGIAAIVLGGLVVGASIPVRYCSSGTRIRVGPIASTYLGNMVGLVLMLTTVPIIASILRVPFAAVVPMIVVSCAIGAYAIQNGLADAGLRRCRLRLQEDRHYVCTGQIQAVATYHLIG